MDRYFSRLADIDRRDRGWLVFDRIRGCAGNDRAIAHCDLADDAETIVVALNAKPRTAKILLGAS